jgi:hypothetical protein
MHVEPSRVSCTLGVLCAGRLVGHAPAPNPARRHRTYPRVTNEPADTNSPETTRPQQHQTTERHPTSDSPGCKVNSIGIKPETVQSLLCPPCEAFRIACHTECARAIRAESDTGFRAAAGRAARPRRVGRDCSIRNLAVAETPNRGHKDRQPAITKTVAPAGLANACVDLRGPTFRRGHHGGSPHTAPPATQPASVAPLSDQFRTLVPTMARAVTRWRRRSRSRSVPPPFPYGRHSGI